MFQARYVTPPLCRPDGFYADTTVHLEIDDPAQVGNWLLSFLRGRCAFVRIDFIKCTLRFRINKSFMKACIFYDPRNTTPVTVELQLYPQGDPEIFMELFRAAKGHLEQAVQMANVRSYAAGYIRAGRLERFATPVLHAPPRDNDDFFYDLPPLLDNMEEVD